MSLDIRNLSVEVGVKKILNGVNLTITAGKLHALMGPNGSGKSTLAQILMGNPAYDIKNQQSLQLPSGQAKIKINNNNLVNLKPDERARLGLFLAFQTPISIPGVSVANLLKTAYQLKSQPASAPKEAGLRRGEQKKMHNPALSVWEFNEMLVRQAKKLGIPQEFLRKGLNEDLSGGEKKKLEMLQAITLQPKFAIFDEIDTGLDVDALKTVAMGINLMKKQGVGILLITHYQRILKYVKPDYVHILVKGKIVQSGNYTLAEEIEIDGYKKWTKKIEVSSD